MISMTIEMEDLMMNMLHIRRNLVTLEETGDHWRLLELILGSFFPSHYTVGAFLTYKEARVV